MSIKIICACGKKFSVKDELAGRKVKCPACQKVLNLAKATAEKVSPSDPQDFEESSEESSDKKPTEVPRESRSRSRPPAREEASAKRKTNSGQAARQTIISVSELREIQSAELRSVQGTKVRAGVSCYFFGVLVIFFAACFVAATPTLYQPDLATLMRVLRGANLVNAFAEVFITIGMGLCLTVSSRMRGRDVLLVAVLSSFLSLLMFSMTTWDMQFSVRVGKWLPQIVLLVAHVSFALFLRRLGEFVDREEIIRGANRVLALEVVGAAIWLGVFRAQPPMPQVSGRMYMTMGLLFLLYGILALIGLFCLIRLLSNCRETLRIAGRAASANAEPENAASENAAADRASRWLSRRDVLTLAVGGGLAAVSLWGWVSLHKPAIRFPGIVPGTPTVMKTPGKTTLVLAGHTSLVSNVAFNSDWTRLATASWDKTIKIWDSTNAKVLHTLTGHSAEARRVVFSPDGKWLASASADKSLKLWDAASGRELRTMTGHTGAVASVAFSPDGKLLASASDDMTVKLWEAATGQMRSTLQGHTEAVVILAFSPDGTRLASAGLQSLKIWDTTRGTELFTFKGHATLIASMEFRPDGKQLATASYDMTVKLWDTTSGQETHSLVGHLGAVMGMTYRPDGQRLVSAGVDMKRKEWDTTSGQLCRTTQAMTAGSLTFSSDGRRLAVWNVGGVVEISDFTTDQSASAVNGHTGAVTGVAFSPNDQLIASSSADQTVRVWNATTGQPIHTLKGHGGPVHNVAFSEDGTALVSVGAHLIQPGAVKVWDANSGQETRSLKVLPTSVVAISEDGTRIASPNLALIGSVPPGKEILLKVWDTTRDQELLALKGHSVPIRQIAFSRDGKWLASESGTFQKPGEIKVWEISSGKERLHLGTPISGLTRVALSPDGKRLATSNSDKTIKVWDTSNGRELLTFKGHNFQAGSLAFSSDGKWLASGCGLIPALPGEMKLFDAATGQEKVALKGHKLSVNCLTFSSDGKRLASASHDETVRVWDTTTGQELLRLGTPAQ